MTEPGKMLRLEALVLITVGSGRKIMQTPREENILPSKRF